MSVVLLILKIIGIILLCVLGLLLAIILLVLLWPITYKADAEFNKPDIKAVAKVRWFIASVPISFIDNKLAVKVKVLGIKVFSLNLGSDEKPDKKSKKDKKAEEIEADKKAAEQSAANQEAVEDIVKDSALDAKDKEDLDSIKMACEEPKPSKSDTELKKEAISLDDELKELEKESSESEEESSDEPKKSLKEKITEKIDWGKDIYTRVSAEISDEKNDIDTYFKRKTTKKSFELIINTVVKLLKHIAPRKITGNLELGLADPATTGYVTAAMSIFCTFTEDAFEFTPVFDDEVINGKVKLKGHILLGYIAVLGVNAIIRKSFRRFIKNSLALKDGALNKVDNIKEIVNGG